MADGFSVLLLGFENRFLKKMPAGEYDIFPKREFYDLIAVSEKGNFEPCFVAAETLLCPQNCHVSDGLKCSVCVTCGMSRMSTLSFSSVRYDSAMLSLSRRIDTKWFSLMQGDCNVIYNHDLTLYENLVLQGLNMIKKCIDCQ